MNRESLLWTPFQLRTIELRNRFVMLAHWNGLDAPDGTPTEDLAAITRRAARGGVGLIVTGSHAVHPSGQMSPNYGRGVDRKAIPAHRRLVEAVHPHGAHVFAQLTHGGHTTLSHPPRELWAPTQMPEPCARYNTVEMGPAEIEAVVEGFAASAANMREAGFDGVEIKVGHDGLLRSFVSPFLNRREDAYGGSFENRMRLPLAVLAATRGCGRPRLARLGPPLPARIHPVRLRPRLRPRGPPGARGEAGTSISFVPTRDRSAASGWRSAGGSAAARLQRPERRPQARDSTAVVAFGRIKNPVDAERILQQGDADLIGMARQLIADPSSPTRCATGASGEVRPCIACNDACILQVMQRNPIRCVQNPAAGREAARRPDAGHDAPPRGGGRRRSGRAERRGDPRRARPSRHPVRARRRARRPHPARGAPALHAEIGESVLHLASEAERLRVELRLGVEATGGCDRDTRPRRSGRRHRLAPLPAGRDAPTDRARPSQRRDSGLRWVGSSPALPTTPGWSRPTMCCRDGSKRGDVSCSSIATPTGRRAAPRVPAGGGAAGRVRDAAGGGRGGPRTEQRRPLPQARPPRGGSHHRERGHPLDCAGRRGRRSTFIRTRNGPSAMSIRSCSPSGAARTTRSTAPCGSGCPPSASGDCRAPRLLQHAIFDGDAIGRDLEARLVAAG